MVTEVTLKTGKKLLFERCLGVVDAQAEDPIKSVRWVAQRSFGRHKLVVFKDEDVAGVKMEESDGSGAFDDPPQKVG